MGSVTTRARIGACAHGGTSGHGRGRRRGVVGTLLLIAATVWLALAGLVADGAHAEAAAAEVDISAYADPPVATAADVITFTVLVENTGDVPLQALTITDGADFTYDHEGLVRLDEMIEHEVTRTIEEDDARVGSVVATFLVEASDEAGNEVRAAETVTVEVLGHPQQRGAAWAGPPGETGEDGASRGLGAGASIGLVLLFTVVAALIGGWFVGRVGRARS